MDNPLIASYLRAMEKNALSELPFDLDYLKQVRAEEMARTFALGMPVVYGMKENPSLVYREFSDGSIRSDGESCNALSLSQDRMVAARRR